MKYLRPPQHDILIGMTGSGKSTIGQLLAKQTNRSYEDTDTWVEQETGQTCTKIIADPDSDFCRIQHGVLSSKPLEYRIPSVIATGASVPMDKVLAEHFRQFGRVIWLDATAEVLEARLSPGRITTLNNPEFTDLLEARRESYMKMAHYAIEISNLEETPAQTAERLHTTVNLY